MQQDAVPAVQVFDMLLVQEDNTERGWVRPLLERRGGCVPSRQVSAVGAEQSTTRNRGWSGEGYGPRRSPSEVSSWGYIKTTLPVHNEVSYLRELHFYLMSCSYEIIIMKSNSCVFFIYLSFKWQQNLWRYQLSLARIVLQLKGFLNIFLLYFNLLL